MTPSLRCCMASARTNLSEDLSSLVLGSEVLPELDDAVEAVPAHVTPADLHRPQLAVLPLQRVQLLLVLDDGLTPTQRVGAHFLHARKLCVLDLPLALQRLH